MSNFLRVRNGGSIAGSCKIDDFVRRKKREDEEDAEELKELC